MIDFVDSCVVLHAQLTVSSVGICNCLSNGLVIKVLNFFRLLKIHLSEHVVVIGLKLVVTIVVLTAFSDLLDGIFVVFKPFVLSILVASPVNRSIQVASKAQSQHHCLCEGLWLTVVKFLGEITAQILNVVPVVPLHDILCGQVDLFFVS